MSSSSFQRWAVALLLFLAPGPGLLLLQAADYHPRFWIEGALGRGQNREQRSDAALATRLDEIQRRGWSGVVQWGADRRGTSMEYYFKSPFLAQQEWAAGPRDDFSALVAGAHERGLKVMINIEGVNPYHWSQHHWTADNIRPVADDLADAGVDAVFEECFEARPEVFVALARELARRKVTYLSGTDPMLLREPSFAALWPETGAINIYNYYLKRDRLFNIATLTQHGSLGYGWAKFWNKPTALISPLTRDWGIPLDYSPAVARYLCLIRALQFRVDDFILFGGFDDFDPMATRQWIEQHVVRQEKSRPRLNVVVLLEPQPSGRGDPGWNRLFNSGDAITSGALHGGFDVVVSNKVVPADAYWIYASGNPGATLPADVVALFDTNKPVFLQSGGTIPSGPNIDNAWKTVLAKCGVDASTPFRSAAGSRSGAGESLPPSQADDLPYTGYYEGAYLRFTGSDTQRGTDLRAGTIVPASAIRGQIVCAPNRTYGRGPFIVGRDRKYLVTATCLNWETAYPIAHLLSGGGIAPTSNVWGIVGKNITALLAIETTELAVTIPGLPDGSPVRVTIYDRSRQETTETAVYRSPFKRFLREYDLLVIDSTQGQ